MQWNTPPILQRLKRVLFFLIMASYILHRTTHSLCLFHCRKKKRISYSIKQCELSTWITIKWHFMNSVHSVTPVFKNTERHCLSVLLLLLDHPNHKYTRILFLLSWLSIKGFIWTFHLILLLLYGWFYLSIRSPSLPLSLHPVKLRLLRLWGASLCTSWDSCLTGPTNDTSKGLVGS